jgi:hypothetical protein
MLSSRPVTKENGSSWIFEPCLTCANVLQRVQHPAFSLVNALPTRPGFIDTTLIIAPGSTSHLLCTTVHLHVGQQPCYLGEDARLQACPRRFRSVIRPLRRPDNPACSPVALAGPGRSYSGWSLRRGPRGHRPSSVGSRRSAAGHGVGDRDVWLVHNRAHGTFRGPAITGNLR